MARILLTGATGLVGSSLVPSLLERGHELVCLVRPQANKSGSRRMQQMLGSLISSTGRVTIAEGDITLPLAGLSPEVIKCLREIEKVVHVAASVKFDRALSEQTWRINAGGTDHMLNLAARLGFPEFHHLSTVYVAGDAETFSEADLDIGQVTRNPYEDSKKAAEKLVRGWGGSYSIYRLGVVVGDTETGAIPSFEGYYGFFVPFWRLLHSIAQSWPEKRAEYLAQGIRVGSDGLLNLPLYLNCSPVSTINLVPIDWLTQTLVALISRPAENKFFHLADPSPPGVRWAAETTLAHMGITGLNFEKPSGSLPGILGRWQRVIDRELRRYEPYITHEARFGQANLLATLGYELKPFPQIDGTFLSKLICYAKTADFGQTISQRKAA